MQLVELLHAVLLQLSVVVMWLTFAIFNFALILLALLFFWLLSITPTELFAWVDGFYQSAHLGIFVSTLALFGASLATVLYWYSRLWRKAYSAIVTPYLFKDIDAFNQKNT